MLGSFIGCVQPEEETGTALKAAAGWWVNMLDADVKVDANSSVVMKFTVDDVIGTDNWSTPDIYLLVETAGDDGALTWVSDVAVARTLIFSLYSSIVTALIVSVPISTQVYIFLINIPQYLNKIIQY